MILSKEVGWIEQILPWLTIWPDKGNKVHLVAHRVATDLLAYPHIQFDQVPKIGNSYILSSPLLNRTGRIWAKPLALEGARVLVNGCNCQWPDVNWVHYVHAAYELNHQVGLLHQLKGFVSRRLFLDEEK